MSLIQLWSINMPLDIDPNWEYWVADPEIESILCKESKTIGFECLGLEELRYKERGWNLGIRFGKGNPDWFIEKLAPPKPEKTRVTVYSRDCRICGVPFIPDRVSRKYCSRNCSLKAFLNRERKRKSVEIPKPITCIACGNQFTSRDSNRKVCNSDCARKLAHINHYKKIDDTSLLLEMYNSGAKVTDICKRFNVKPVAVRRAVKKVGGVVRKPGNRSRVSK